MNKLSPVVTIDGPGSSGKGTVGRLLAKDIGWHFLDSGTLYRALAFMMDKKNVLPENRAGIEMLIQTINLTFEFLSPPLEHTIRIRLNGENVTQILVTEACGKRASQIAVFPEVREALLEKQREFRKLPGLVADGRDMGSVVFPDADLKIFLSASLQKRAFRRYSQLKEQGINGSLAAIETELKARDERDENRMFAPLKSAEDAICIDTTDLSVVEVVDRIKHLLRERLES